jgi:ataxin-3
VDEFALADIARELDERERVLMMEAGADTADALKYLAEDSINVDDSGNFSVTVLKEALARGHSIGLEADNSLLVAALEDPGKHEAYFLNLGEHWFTIRRLETLVGPKWFNLNSLLKRPEVIGDFYLSAFLAEMRAEGYCIFIVTGSLPRPLADRSLGEPSCWHTVGAIIRSASSGASSSKAKADARRAAAKRAQEAASMDPDYAAALRASMASGMTPKCSHVIIRRSAKCHACS